jgi:predicted permease
LGVFLAQMLSRFLVVFLSTSADPVFLDLALDWRVLGFAAFTAILTCLVFGLAPALLATRLDLAPSMKEAGRGTTAGAGRVPLRRILLTAQVAFSLVLVASAMIFSRSLASLLTVDAGFQARGVMTATVVFQRLNLPPERLQPFKEDLIERTRQLPGVEAVAVTGMVPLRGFGSVPVRMADEDAASSRRTQFSRVGPGYFETLGIRLLTGREFGSHDRLGTPPVAIVNEAFARRLTGGASPIGRRLVVGAMAGSPESPYEVIGLVRDTKYANLREEFAPIVYTAPAQDPNWGPGMQVLIRSRLPEAESVAAIKSLLNQIHPSITVSFQGFESLIESTILRDRLIATLSVTFGLLALVLACIGLYGLLSYTASARTNEIGIRMALGAARAEVFWLILREAVWLVLVGIAAGLPAVLAVTHLTSSLLYGVTPIDIVSLASAGLLLLVAALVGGCVPSHSATRVHPMVALRRD